MPTRTSGCPVEYGVLPETFECSGVAREGGAGEMVIAHGGRSALDVGADKGSLGDAVTGVVGTCRVGR
jgi:hypothetical protein